MLTIPIDLNASQYLYEQIYDYLKREILSGNLPCHTKLPSARSLADHLSISRNTADLAYAQLVSEGYVESIPRKGYFVNEISGLGMLSQPQPSPDGADFRLSARPADPPRLSDPEPSNSISLDSCPSHCRPSDPRLLVPGTPDSSISKASNCCEEALQKQSNDTKTQIFADFSPFSVDLSHFPFATWQQLSKNCLRDNRQLFLSGDHQGDPAFREAIRSYLYQSRGVSCQLSQIIVGAGVDYLLQLLINILGFHHSIAMENPVYKRAESIFRSFGLPVSPISLDHQGLRASDLAETSCDLVYVTPSHQYPMGTVMSIQRRNELLQWAKQPGRYIIEDDHDSEFRYKGRPIPSLKSIAARDNVIYIGTFSRAIAPAIRVGYMVLPEDLLLRYRSKCGFYACTVSRIDQAILTRFLNGGYFERHLNRMRKVYKMKHDLMLSLLKKQTFVQSVFGAYSGMHLVARLEIDESEESFASWALMAGVKVYGLKEHFIELPKTYAPTLLFGYANLTVEQMLQALEVLEKLAKHAKNSGTLPDKSHDTKEL